MHGIGGVDFSVVHDFFGAGHGSEDEGVVVRDVAVRIHDGGGARVLRGADDGNERDQHDAEGDSRRERVQWEGFFALRRVALVSCRCWYLVTGKVKLMFFFFLSACY